MGYTHWKTLRKIGAWPALQHFKQQLTLINEQETKQLIQQAFPLWSFSGYNHYSTEVAPLQLDNNYRSEGFWETIHYHTQLGDLMLNCLFELDTENSYSRPFGVQLSGTILVSHKAQQTQVHCDYQATHPEDIRTIQGLLKQENHEK